MANCPHNTFSRGKRILILFKDGSRTIDKYIDSKRGCLIMERLGRVKLNTVRQTIIYKPQQAI